MIEKDKKDVRITVVTDLFEFVGENSDVLCDIISKSKGLTIEVGRHGRIEAFFWVHDFYSET